MSFNPNRVIQSHDKRSKEVLDNLKTNSDTHTNATIRGINNTGSIGDGSLNHTSVALGYDRSNGKARALLVDADGKLEVNNSDIEVNTDGLETLLTASNNGTLRGINNTASIGDGSTNATAVCLGYDRSGGKGRAILVDADGHIQCDILSGGGGDASASNQTTMITELGNIKTAVELLDNAVSGNELQVDVVSSALPTGASTLAKQDEIKDKIVLPTTLGQKANANCLATCRSTTTGAYDLSARTDIALASSSKKILCDSDGKLIISNTQNVGVKLADLSSTFDSDHSNHTRSIGVGIRARTNITDNTTGKFILCNSAGKLQVNSQSRTTGELYASTSLSANTDASASSVDLSDYKQIHIFGENTHGSNNVDLQIWGSQTSSGTYYWLGSLRGTLTLQTIMVSAVNKHFYNLVIDNPPPFIKIRNNTGSDTQFELDFVGTKV